MDISAILDELRAELANIDKAIMTLEYLLIDSERGGKRRGRPPSWMAQAKANLPLSRQPRVRSAAGRSGAENNDVPPESKA